MGIAVNGTPLETVTLGGASVLVKRDDLSAPLPGPQFSKMRGVVAHIEARPERHIGVLDTFHSKAGWAVAMACQQLGRQAYVFWPRYKSDEPGCYREPQQRAQAMGAKLVALQAGRSAILYHGARREMRTVAAEFDSPAYLMPNALKLDESVTENAAEVWRTNLPQRCAIVISVSSGTVAAGIIRGLSEKAETDEGARHHVILHMGYARSEVALQAYVRERAERWKSDQVRIEIVNEKYAYKDHVESTAPFPCNPYYDAKAWKWLEQPGRVAELEKAHGRVVFWNIGA